MSAPVNSGVYFLRAEDTGPIKIGFSGDIVKRVRDLQVGCPYRLCLLAVIPDGNETQLHWRFIGGHVHGEWFLATNELLSFIAALPVQALPTLRPPFGFKARNSPPRIDSAKKGRVSELLRAVREHLGISQQEMGALCGMSRVYYNAVENNRSALGSCNTREGIAVGLGVELGTLIEYLDGGRPIAEIVTEWAAIRADRSAA